MKIPIYEYVSDDYGERYERIVVSQQQAITCPKCSSAKNTIQLSVFATPTNGNKSTAGSSASAPSGGGCSSTPRTCDCH